MHNLSNWQRLKRLMITIAGYVEKEALLVGMETGVSYLKGNLATSSKV